MRDSESPTTASRCRASTPRVIAPVGFEADTSCFRRAVQPYRRSRCKAARLGSRRRKIDLDHTRNHTSLWREATAAFGRPFSSARVVQSIARVQILRLRGGDRHLSGCGA